MPSPEVAQSPSAGPAPPAPGTPAGAKGLGGAGLELGLGCRALAPSRRLCISASSPFSFSFPFLLFSPSSTFYTDCCCRGIFLSL